jgi:prepilin-type N-terminal cleavage/methylation domain-containing protein
MHRLHDERGYTLIELMVSMVIGLVVIFAAWMILDASGSLSKRTQDRVDAAQRGRLAMDVIGSELRSQVCLPGAVAPMVAGATSTDFTFYSNLGDQNSPPQKRRFYVQNGAIKEQTWQGTYSGFGTNLTVNWAATPTSRTLVEPVGQVSTTSGTMPYFRFWGFDANLPATINQPLDALPLSATDAGRVVQVDISFDSRPTGATASGRRDSIFQQSIYFRTADPMDPGKGPKCQ